MGLGDDLYGAQAHEVARARSFLLWSIVQGHVCSGRHLLQSGTVVARATQVAASLWGQNSLIKLDASGSRKLATNPERCKC